MTERVVSPVNYRWNSDRRQKVPGPDFFIVGAPKCGTTSLAQYLREHPGVFIPRGEPHYFLPAWRRFPMDRDEYLRLFEPARGC